MLNRTAAADDDRARRARTSRPPRRPSPPTGDERRAAILETAERLLGERSLRDISIDELARGAGISRPTFYFYFGSKDEVLLTLLEGVVEQVDRVVAVGIEHLSEDPEGWWRRALASVFDSFEGHRAVTLALAEAYAAGGPVRTRWAAFMDNWIEATALAIESERARGAAPAGLPARDLAILLNSMNERVLLGTFGGFGGEASAIPPDRVVDSLLTLWLGAIYH